MGGVEQESRKGAEHCELGKCGRKIRLWSSTGGREKHKRHQKNPENTIKERKDLDDGRKVHIIFDCVVK